MELNYRSIYYFFIDPAEQNFMPVISRLFESKKTCNLCGGVFSAGRQKCKEFAFPVQRAAEVCVVFFASAE
jgi:hypothetical protein